MSIYNIYIVFYIIYICIKTFIDTSSCLHVTELNILFKIELCIFE